MPLNIFGLDHERSIPGTHLPHVATAAAAFLPFSLRIAWSLGRGDGRLPTRTIRSPISHTSGAVQCSLCISLPCATWIQEAWLKICIKTTRSQASHLASPLLSHTRPRVVRWQLLGPRRVTFSPNPFASHHTLNNAIRKIA